MSKLGCVSCGQSISLSAEHLCRCEACERLVCSKCASYLEVEGYQLRLCPDCVVLLKENRLELWHVSLEHMGYYLTKDVDEAVKRYERKQRIRRGSLKIEELSDRWSLRNDV